MFHYEALLINIGPKNIAILDKKHDKYGLKLHVLKRSYIYKANKQVNNK